ncbi:TIGR00297 family protein [Granulicella rosea]|uniref:TIGR00297 family protein n=1 Tax=Granulicella rosea TaxID=474952 RepID=A0A239IVI4_9BACT|nr:DUF92 domain-containing protein [Granulicella rosea]SNS97579.1 TIGR00297 family protein [Granulicella rosea]
MTQDVSPIPEARPWKKAIPEARDRLQSKILVWIAVPVLCWLAFETRTESFADHRTVAYLEQVFAVSIFFALATWRMRAATWFAAFTGAVICFLITLYTGPLVGLFMHGGGSIFHSCLTPLIFLFLLTFSATRFRRERKSEASSAEHRRGRTTAQIVANLGVAGALSSYWGFFGVSLVMGYGGTITGSLHSVLDGMVIYNLPVLAALAEATADTVSSEIGQAFGGKTYLLASFRQVPPGTDGAVSLIGTTAGIMAAAIVAYVGIPASGLDLSSCTLVFASGVLGLLFDSVLGATVERKGWLGNDLVNFTSTAFAALVSMIGIRLFDGLMR